MPQINYLLVNCNHLVTTKRTDRDDVSVVYKDTKKTKHEACP
jgi:hypothetical protein